MAVSSNDLRVFLFKNLYHHKDVSTPNLRGEHIISEVFDSLIKNPSLLGETSNKRIKNYGLHRTVCDYVAGMTDRYVMEKYDSITNQ